MIPEIVGTATVTVALLVLGVQILFYTKTFGEEYEKKRDAIREAKNAVLVEEIERLFALRKKVREAKERPRKAEEVYIDEGDEVRQFESLARVRQVATEVQEWVGVIERGKKLIRRLGLSIVASGVVVGTMFMVTISSEQMLLVSIIALYVLGPLLILVLFHAVRYLGLVRRIDEEITEVMQRKTGMGKEA